MIYFTGDTHGEFNRFSSKNFPIGKTLDEDDVIIVLGDFGLFWENFNNREAYKKGWLESKPFTIAFIPGNHENYDFLNAKEMNSHIKTEKWEGQVRKFGSNIYMLERGESYVINGYSILTMGGGLSIDKGMRREFISWWKEEYPSEEEWKRFENNAYKKEYDFVLTHVPPRYLIPQVLYSMGQYSSWSEQKCNDEVAIKLEEYCNKIKFKYWLFGHMHTSKFIAENKFMCLYEAIKNVDEVINSFYVNEKDDVINDNF